VADRATFYGVWLVIQQGISYLVQRWDSKQGHSAVEVLFSSIPYHTVLLVKPTQVWS